MRRAILLNVAADGSMSMLNTDKPYTPNTKIETALSDLSSGFDNWKSVSVSDRIEHLLPLKEYLLDYADDYAHLMAKEMGKPIRDGIGEIKKCAGLIDYYAETAADYLEGEALSANESIHYSPLGVILGVMPWNFPFWQVFRFAIPTLISGNAVLLKHASNVYGCAHQIEHIFQELPGCEHIFRSIEMPGAEVTGLISHPDIKGVSITGGSEAGQSVGAAAGASIKPCVLELGGSDPFIVCPDADIDLAAQAAVQARFKNAGQVCISAKRFIIHDSIWDDFVERFISYTDTLKLGDPLQISTEMGPMARPEMIAELNEQLNRSKAHIEILYERENTPDPSIFFPPCILKVNNREAAVWREETFGPIAVLHPYSSIEEAVFLANDTSYGLGASIWTTDDGLGKQIAKRIDAGSIFINTTVTSLFHLPFGGTKCSGIGRELGKDGLVSFCNKKTILLKQNP